MKHASSVYYEPIESLSRLSQQTNNTYSTGVLYNAHINSELQCFGFVLFIFVVIYAYSCTVSHCTNNNITEGITSLLNHIGHCLLLLSTLLFIYLYKQYCTRLLLYSISKVNSSPYNKALRTDRI